MFYVFDSGCYIENEIDGLVFQDVNIDLRNRIKSQYVNIDDALEKKFINESEYEELINNYFCWIFKQQNGYSLEWLNPVYKYPDGSFKPDAFAYDDIQGVNTHFKEQYSNGFNFVDIQKIIDQGFTTQQEVDEIKNIRDEIKRVSDERFNHAIFLNSVETSTVPHTIFESIFDQSGIISDGGFGLRVSYDTANKSFTCFIPEYARELIPILNEKPNYFLEIANDVVPGFKWDSIKNIDSFEIFQINSLGERHELTGEIRLKAYYHKLLTVV